VTGETNYNSALKNAYNTLLTLDGVGEATASNLYQLGFKSLKMVSEASVSDLMQVDGIGEEKAGKIIRSAVELLEIEKDRSNLEQKMGEEAATEPEAHGEG
jgi:ERCC4-type nuclease